jgi:hypothetical protein
LHQNIIHANIQPLINMAERPIEITEAQLKQYFCRHFTNPDGENIGVDQTIRCFSPVDGTQILRTAQGPVSDPGTIIYCRCSITGWKEVEAKVSQAGEMVEPPTSDIDPTRVRKFRRG